MTEKNRVPLRCRLKFHAWAHFDGGWGCRRCVKELPRCTNCGRQHDPNVITICTVERRS